MERTRTGIDSHLYDLGLAGIASPAAIRDRMPVVLRKWARAAWCDATVTEADQVDKIVRTQVAEEIKYCAVSGKANSAREDGPELIEPGMKTDLSDLDCAAEAKKVDCCSKLSKVTVLVPKMRPHEKKASKQRTFTAVDLFSGCGGLTVGLRRAGFTVRAAVEVDSKAQETYRVNHPDVRLYAKDIRKLSARSVLADLGLGPGQLDLLAGCPPCQGFSRLRTRNRRASVRDPRNDLVSDFLRFVRILRPKTVMLENVPSLAQDRRFAHLRRELSRLGYENVFHILNAADFGVAQRRKRLILLASRVHYPATADKSGRAVTVRHVLKGVERPSTTNDSLHAVAENRTAEVRALIRLIPHNGGSRSDLPPEYRLACHERSDGFRDVYGRMAWDDVAPTITGGCINPSKGRFLHPTQNRTITLREAALLQGFPRRYKFDVSHGKEAIALMIGNALPPPFIAAHARELRRGIEYAMRREDDGD